MDMQRPGELAAVERGPAGLAPALGDARPPWPPSGVISELPLAPRADGAMPPPALAPSALAHVSMLAHMLPTNPMLFQQLHMQMNGGVLAPPMMTGAMAGSGSVAQGAAVAAAVMAAGVDAAAAAAAAAAGANMGMGLSGGAPEPSQTLLAQNEQSFVCNICRKSFKREMNLIFHMTTHRQRQTVEGVGEIQHSNAPVKCSDCDKVFATKYQAKKHFLRRHFKGDRPYKCRKCNKKSFTVKEDLTMHMKACGQVFSCSCGIRLCSLGALKRHAKYFEHTPSSWDGLPVANGTGAGEFGGGLDEHGKEAGGGMEDDMDDSDDEGVLLPPATQGGVGGVGGNGGGGGASGGGGEASHRGLMIGVDMADGAAAQALLMADQQSRTHRFEPAAGGALAQGLQGLWQTQQQLGQLGGGGLQLGDSELMRQHMQTHALLSQQQFQHIMAEQLQAHPQMAAHYNNATLQNPNSCVQHAMQHAQHAPYSLPAGMTMNALQQSAYGGRQPNNAAHFAAADAAQSAVDVVANAPSMSTTGANTAGLQQFPVAVHRNE